LSTSQGYIPKYENLKRKLYNHNANIYFNQKYLRKHLIPNCAIKNFQILRQLPNLHKKIQLNNKGLYQIPIHQTTTELTTLTLTIDFTQLKEKLVTLHPTHN
jgi:hypothetical protein